MLAQVFAFLFGLMVGSFLNVVIARLPVMLKRQWQIDCAESTKQAPPQFDKFNLAVPGSRCPHCETSLRWYENIPVLSYALQRGKCRHCSAKISIRYPIVELAAACLTWASVYQFGFTLLALSYVAFLLILLTLSCIDLDEMLLPDQITLPFIWLGLILSISVLPISPIDSIIGATAGYLVLWSVFWLFKLATGKEGMGYGDFKLLAALGAWLGWKFLPFIVLASSVIGALVGIAFLLLKKSKAGQAMPFGPFIAAAGVVALFWGAEIYTWYWELNT
ncbi:A24 family peptidase [Aliidiomarina sp. B3213]|nr:MULTISPECIES: A24 family peptidase [Gammaproteobacteria]RTE86786.1 prepilin peptidase [Aliidiomarina sp. B3213]TCZ91779.1 prepilin peptidase [Lysobacter sp. N42]